MDKPSIDYFFAPQSPWTYLGHARFCALVRRAGATVRIKPCDLTRVFAQSGGLPLAQRATQRQTYRLIELRRFSARLDITLHLRPRFFPVPAEPAAYLILAADRDCGTEAALELIGAIGRAVWAEERDIADAATLVSIADGVGLDGAALLTESRTAAIDATYQHNTDDALAAEVFGAPTYVLAGERFWGQDRLDFLEQALSGPAW